jgi:predicted enzyme related to lactoylglutathione lyase
MVGGNDFGQDTATGEKIHRPAYVGCGKSLSFTSFARSIQPSRPRVALGRRDTGEKTVAKITGIGGVFFKSTSDRAALAEWYRKHLGMPLEDFGGAILRWPNDVANDGGVTVWHVAGKDSEWFSPSKSSFMINYRVDNLDELLEQLRAGGVEIVQGPESDDNGKFAWIMDPDNNKVELWEPKAPAKTNP